MKITKTGIGIALALIVILFLALSESSHAQTYNLFKPANGVLKGSTSTYVTTAATAADIVSLWTGTCTGTNVLQGNGVCGSGGGGGGSPGGSNTNVQFNSSGSFGGSGDFTWTAASSKIDITSSSVGPQVVWHDATGYTWRCGTDGTTGNWGCFETIRGVQPLTLLQVTGAGGGVNFVGQIQVDGAHGATGQVLSSQGTADPIWASPRSVGTLAATAIGVSTLGIGSTACIAPTSTVTVTSSTTMTDDGDLQLVLVPVGSYKIDVTLDWTFTNNTGGVKAQIVFDGGSGTGPTYSGVAACNNAPTPVAVSLNGGAVFDCAGTTGTDANLTVTGFITFAVQGDLAVQWAQHASNATGTVRTAYGSMCITRLN